MTELAQYMPLFTLITSEDGQYYSSNQRPLQVHKLYTILKQVQCKSVAQLTTLGKWHLGFHLENYMCGLLVLFQFSKS